MDVLMTRFSAQSFAMLVFMLPVATASADALHDELRVCRDLPDDDARLICYDAAVDRSRQSGYISPAAPSEKPPSAAPAEPAGAPGNVAATGAAVDLSQEDLFGKTGDEVGRTVEEATGSERIDSLSATVTKLQQYSYGKVLITLDNGQLWKQIDTSNLRLRAGDAVVIERASLGSFMLKKQGSKRSMRVSRED
jgi:hypothetical protein